MGNNYNSYMTYNGKEYNNGNFNPKQQQGSYGYGGQQQQHSTSQAVMDDYSQYTGFEDMRLEQIDPVMSLII